VVHDEAASDFHPHVGKPTNIVARIYETVSMNPQPQPRLTPQDYLLVAQTECRVEHYAREAAGRWLLTEYRSRDDTIDLPAAGCRLLLREMYERVSL